MQDREELALKKYMADMKLASAIPLLHREYVAPSTYQVPNIAALQS